MLIKPFICFLALFLSLSTAASAAACYTPVEVEAEQGLRIHSELMVIALTCVKSPEGGAALYARYQYFTERNKKLISAYENDMLRYLKTQGGGAEEKLHNLRTKLANQISQHAISMSVDHFCRKFAPRIEQAVAMDEAKVRRWAQHSWPGTTTTVAACTASPAKKSPVKKKS